MMRALATCCCRSYMRAQHRRGKKETTQPAVSRRSPARHVPPPCGGASQCQAAVAPRPRSLAWPAACGAAARRQEGRDHHRRRRRCRRARVHRPRSTAEESSASRTPLSRPSRARRRAGERRPSSPTTHPRPAGARSSIILEHSSRPRDLWPAGVQASARRGGAGRRSPSSAARDTLSYTRRQREGGREAARGCGRVPSSSEPPARSPSPAATGASRPTPVGQGGLVGLS